MKHLLVTNDFPPKHGGIQSYLWELWRRLPPADVTVLTTPYPGDRAWDAEQPWRVIRSRQKVLLPTPSLRDTVDQAARDAEADLVVLDPALPLGMLGPHLERPYGLVLHGAEITVPGRTPGARAALAHVLRGATTVIAAGSYPADEAERAADRVLPITVVPPGVDNTRFVPLDLEQRKAARRRFALPADAPLVVSVSRLVPRKGMDVVIEAAARLGPRYPDLLLAIAGGGRDSRRLDRLASRTGAPVRMLGRVPDGDLPSLYGSADVFAMLCRSRWLGLEQEGFGIVFLEAAASGVPQIAGDSGGAAEAVVDGETGLVVSHPDAVDDVVAAMDRLLGDDELRHSMGQAARRRTEAEFSYDVLATRLDVALSQAR